MRSVTWNVSGVFPHTGTTQPQAVYSHGLSVVRRSLRSQHGLAYKKEEPKGARSMHLGVCLNCKLAAINKAHPVLAAFTNRINHSVVTLSSIVGVITCAA
jgi:hypothetical protein